MINKLSQHSLYAFAKGIPGRINLQATYQLPMTRSVEKARQYPQLVQQVQKVTIGSLHGLADRLSPGRRLAQIPRFHSQFQTEVVSAKTLGGGRPEDRASVMGSTHYSKQTKAYPYEGYLLSPALVQAQQKKFLSRKTTNEPRPDMPYSEAKNATLVSPYQRAATALALERRREDGVAIASFTSTQLVMDAKPTMTGKKHATIFLAEKVYRESIAKATHVLMSLEKEIQRNDKDFSIVDKYTYGNNEEKIKIRHALHNSYVIPLINDAKKQILELSENLSNFFDSHSFSDSEKSRASVFQLTAKNFFSRKLAGIESLT